MEFCWEEAGAMLLQLTFSEIRLLYCGSAANGLNGMPKRKSWHLPFMDHLDILEIRNMTILADRGVLEIAVNEDTACYYVGKAESL